MAGVPNSPVLNFTEAIDGPITAGRDLTTTNARTGHTRLRDPLLVDGARPTTTLPVPHLGEHNDELRAPRPRTTTDR